MTNVACEDILKLSARNEFAVDFHRHGLVQRPGLSLVDEKNVNMREKIRSEAGVDSKIFLTF